MYKTLIFNILDIIIFLIIFFQISIFFLTPSVFFTFGNVFTGKMLLLNAIKFKYL